MRSKKTVQHLGLILQYAISPEKRVSSALDRARRGEPGPPDEFVAHYHLERNYQGLGNRLITPQAIPANSNGTIQRRQRLGGMLNHYHRAA